MIRRVKDAHTDALILNDDTDDEDHDENDAVTISMNNKAQTLLIGRFVNNYSL